MNGFEFKNAKDGKATLYVYENIGESWFSEDPLTAKRFSDELKALGSVKEINVRINSVGGSVFDARAMASQLRDHPAKIVVDIDGVCASAATYIACVGSECRIAPDGVYMVHLPSGICVGTADEMRKSADALDVILNGMMEVYTSRTKKPAKEIRSLVDAETWMTPEQALEHGFVDKISENPMRLAASAERSKFANMTLPFRNLPDSLKERVKFTGESAATETAFDAGSSRMVIPVDAFRQREADEAKRMVEEMRAKVKARREAV
jgi:ATP-dependent Clp protease protease subunit